jgi:hypothetical protein
VCVATRLLFIPEAAAAQRAQETQQVSPRVSLDAAGGLFSKHRPQSHGFSFDGGALIEVSGAKKSANDGELLL